MSLRSQRRAVPPDPPAPGPGGARAGQGVWKRCLWGGLALWVVTAAVTYATKNTNLLPTLILLGSFLVPGVFVLWAYDRHGRDLGLHVLISCFVVGGILGVLGASVLEGYLLHPSVWMFVGVGLIEEFVKLLALAFVVRRRKHLHGLRYGLLLGAAVGFGFAAFESAGYAFNAALTLRGLDLRALLETEMLRGLLAPFGHGLWTAIAGGVLLKYRKADGRFRLTGPVIGTYLGVSLLHALWDSMHGIAVWLVAHAAPVSELQKSLFAQGYVPQPTSEQKHLFTLFSYGGLVFVSLMGAAWLLSLARQPKWNRENH
jgi:RsiW-degrading membrane proteinase PrsW (M82 family)